MYGQLPPNDLACIPHHHLWTIVATPTEREFIKDCVYANTYAVDGAMTWIGDKMPESRNWTDYTFQAQMTPTFINNNTDIGGNGGIAFHIKDVGDYYYAVSIFPRIDSNIMLHLEKWHNGEGNNYALVEYNVNMTWKIGQLFDL